MLEVIHGFYVVPFVPVPDTGAREVHFGIEDRGLRSILQMRNRAAVDAVIDLLTKARDQSWPTTEEAARGEAP